MADHISYSYDDKNDGTTKYLSSLCSGSKSSIEDPSVGVFEDERSASSVSFSDDQSSSSSSSLPSDGSIENDPIFSADDTSNKAFDEIIWDYQGGRFKKEHAFILANTCILLLIILIGLGAGIGSKMNEGIEPDDFLSPSTNLSRDPEIIPMKSENDHLSDPYEIFVKAIADTTVYRNGEFHGVANGENQTMLVQNGPPGAYQLPSTYSLVEFPFEEENVLNIEEGSAQATLCLEHVPTEARNDSIVTYSVCLLPRGKSPMPIDNLTGVVANWVMPGDCLDRRVIDFNVHPSDESICVDVTSLLFESSLLSSKNLRKRTLRDDVSGLLRVPRNRATREKSFDTIVIMIDHLVESDEPGDRFFTRNNRDPQKVPSLMIHGEIDIEEESEKCQSIYEIICTSADLSNMCRFIILSGLEGMLKSGDTITTFAPTNTAFHKMLDEYDELNLEDIRDILLYHITSGQLIKYNDIDCRSQTLLEMANTESVQMKCEDDRIYVIGDGNSDDAEPQITAVDIEACNGILQVVDEVILPSNEEFLTR